VPSKTSAFVPWPVSLLCLACVTLHGLCTQSLSVAGWDLQGMFGAVA